MFAIALRLRAESYMLRLIDDSSTTDQITKNQTWELFKLVEAGGTAGVDELRVLRSVLLTTAETLHINSFMYEPIIDMSDQALRSLYSKVSALELAVVEQRGLLERLGMRDGFAGGCGRVRRQETSRAASLRAKVSRGALRWAVTGIVMNHLTVARVADGLGVAWHTANSAILAEGQRVLIGDPARYDRVRVIRVDEHVWRHTRFDDEYVTVIIDYTPNRDPTGPARLLDMVPGRSIQVFKQ